MELNSWMNPKNYLNAVEMNNTESFKTFSAPLMSNFRTLSQHFSTCVVRRYSRLLSAWKMATSNFRTFQFFSIRRNPESTDWLTTQQTTQTGGR